MGQDLCADPWLQFVGLVSFYLFYLTFRENSYLSPVRIQVERGQKLVKTGPYRHVRHPMYAAFALYIIGTALMLGSWAGLASGPPKAPERRGSVSIGVGK